MRAIDYSNFEMTLIAPDGEATKVDLPTRLKQFGLLATTDRHLVVQLAAEAPIAGRSLPPETLLAYDVDGISRRSQPSAGGLFAARW